jgi:hypothetical protein
MQGMGTGWVGLGGGVVGPHKHRDQQNPAKFAKPKQPITHPTPTTTCTLLLFDATIRQAIPQMPPARPQASKVQTTARLEALLVQRSNTQVKHPRPPSTLSLGTHPMVASEFLSNWLVTNRRTMELLPTPVWPSRTTFTSRASSSV